MQQASTDPVRMRVELTPKQAAFARLVARGVGLSEAYRQCYSTRANGTSLRVQAWRLSRNPKVAQRIEELREGSLQAKLDNDDLTLRWIMGRLREEATDMGSPASARVRALEILGKAHGLFDNTVVAVEPRSPEEVEVELMERLTAIMPMIST